MSALDTLFRMDGYGPYVWACYAVFVLMLLWDLAMPWLRQRRVLADIRNRARREAARKQTRTESIEP